MAVLLVVVRYQRLLARHRITRFFIWGLPRCNFTGYLFGHSQLPLTGGTSAAGLDWALLIAGSAGWGNYRHQADICHVRCTLPLHDKQPRFVALTQGHMQAYQVLRDGGLPEERIVVMMADDIAHNPLNPHPGKVQPNPCRSEAARHAAN